MAISARGSDLGRKRKLSVDGVMLIAGRGGGQLRFWETASGRLLWTMPAHRSDLVGVHVEGDDIVTRDFLVMLLVGACRPPAR
jgi:hypothetical protein